MHLDPAIPAIVVTLGAIVGAGLVLRLLKQPHVVGYVVVGVLLGPHGFAVMSDLEGLSRLGAVGVIFLLFFVGMEVSPHRLVSTWRVSVIGTGLQILTSVAAIAVVGWLLDWSLGRVVMIGFVISLSSTAVVLKVLENWGELGTPRAEDAIGVLLVQDLAVIPMVIVVGLLGGGDEAASHWHLQLIGAAILIAIVVWLLRAKEIQLPFGQSFREDRELQIFASLAICFGLGLLTGFFQLSSALGAFVGGMIVGASKQTKWVHESLEPFRIVFLALFFVSVGMLVDLSFVMDRLGLVVALLFLALLTNTLLNAVILRFLGYSWPDSLYSGTLLGPIGEFSFVLSSVGFQAGIINEAGYQLCLAVIALCLTVSPLWMSLGKRIRDRDVR